MRIVQIEEFDREERIWEPLSYLFGSYINQDVLDDYGDIWPAVSAFREENTESDVAGSAASARRLASEFDDDDVTEQAAHRLGLAYSPRADGWSCKDWLAALADFLETGNRPDR